MLILFTGMLSSVLFYGNVLNFKDGIYINLFHLVLFIFCVIFTVMLLLLFNLLRMHAGCQITLCGKLCIIRFKILEPVQLLWSNVTITRHFLMAVISVDALFYPTSVKEWVLN